MATSRRAGGRADSTHLDLRAKYNTVASLSVCLVVFPLHKNDDGRLLYDHCVPLLLLLLLHCTVITSNSHMSDDWVIMTTSCLAAAAAGGKKKTERDSFRKTNSVGKKWTLKVKLFLYISPQTCKQDVNMIHAPQSPPPESSLCARGAPPRNCPDDEAC